jgi:hypothetical protein
MDKFAPWRLLHNLPVTWQQGAVSASIIKIPCLFYAPGQIEETEYTVLNAIDDVVGQFPRTRGHVRLFDGGSSDLFIVVYVYNVLATSFCLRAGTMMTWRRSRCRNDAGAVSAPWPLKVISRLYVFIHEEKDNLPPRDENGGLPSKQQWRCGTITHSNRQVSMYCQMLVTRFGKKSKKTTFCGWILTRDTTGDAKIPKKVISLTPLLHKYDVSLAWHGWQWRNIQSSLMEILWLFKT